MIADIGVVVWKELRELRHQRSVIFSAAVLLAVFGVLLPSQSDVESLSSTFGAATMAFVPFAIIIAIIADSFAGERERHTLESLLATRLSDGALLFGKLVTAVAWGWTLAVAQSILAVVTIDARAGVVAAYAPKTWLVGLVLSLLVAVFMSALGVLVSLRAATVKQAQQVLALVFALTWVLFLVGARLLPADVRTWLLHFIATAGETTLLLVAMGIAAAVDGVLLVACVARFRRARLILD